MQTHRDLVETFSKIKCGNHKWLGWLAYLNVSGWLLTFILMSPLMCNCWNSVQLCKYSSLQVQGQVRFNCKVAEATTMLGVFLSLNFGCQYNCRDNSHLCAVTDMISLTSISEFLYSGASQPVVGVDGLRAGCFTNPWQHWAKEVHYHGLSCIPNGERKQKFQQCCIITTSTIINYLAHFPL